MSDASDRLARSRLAIVEHIHRKERRREPRREMPQDDPFEGAEFADTPPPPPGDGLLDRIRYAASMWWRHHPAHMAVEVATPLMHAYAARKPGQLLAISALAGATLMLARPWRLISLTALLGVLLKSSHLPSVILSAMSAADFERDHRGPG
jgi:hypothetical protein